MPVPCPSVAKAPTLPSVPDAGFSLVEVLVALLVVALGIAGAAGLQARALRAGREAAHLSTGTQLASSLAERMRANPAAMGLADAANPYLQLDYDAAAGPPPQGAASCYAAAGCTPAQLAAFDLFETEQALAARLPGGRIRVCRDATPPDPVSGLEPWSCDGQAGAPLAIKLGWHGPGAADAPRLLLLVGAAPAAAAAAAAGAPSCVRCCCRCRCRHCHDDALRTRARTHTPARAA